VKLRELRARLRKDTRPAVDQLDEFLGLPSAHRTERFVNKDGLMIDTKDGTVIIDDPLYERAMDDDRKLALDAFKENLHTYKFESVGTPWKPIDIKATLVVDERLTADEVKKALDAYPRRTPATRAYTPWTAADANKLFKGFEPGKIAPLPGRQRR
jgi:hypothetical protein